MQPSTPWCLLGGLVGLESLRVVREHVGERDGSYPADRNVGIPPRLTSLRVGGLRFPSALRLPGGLRELELDCRDSFRPDCFVGLTSEFLCVDELPSIHDNNLMQV
jgi:hypothetical protein